MGRKSTTQAPPEFSGAAVIHPLWVNLWFEITYGYVCLAFCVTYLMDQTNDCKSFWTQLRKWLNMGQVYNTGDKSNFHLDSVTFA